MDVQWRRASEYPRGTPRPTRPSTATATAARASEYPRGTPRRGRDPPSTASQWSPRSALGISARHPAAGPRPALQVQGGDATHCHAGKRRELEREGSRAGHKGGRRGNRCGGRRPRGRSAPLALRHCKGDPRRNRSGRCDAAATTRRQVPASTLDALTNIDDVPFVSYAADWGFACVYFADILRPTRAASGTPDGLRRARRRSSISTVARPAPNQKVGSTSINASRRAESPGRAVRRPESPAGRRGINRPASRIKRPFASRRLRETRSARL